MSSETRSVVVKLRAEASGFVVEFDKAGRASDRLAKNVDRSGASVDKLIRRARNLALGAGLAKLAVDAVKMEAAYSKTLAQVAVATKAPHAELDKLDKLALKLGADTVFSAQDAANAMLELAKGGLSPAQIQAGALANSLTLAAAGNIDLGVAANSVVNTMGAFKLGAKDTGAAVAALAGAANASSANVSDITQALSQAGVEAHSAGLSVQETTAILASFANSGIQGSDAGTSLKTMLSRLVPQTKEAATEMGRLHLKFTDANGEFVSAEEIAGKLQTAYKGMSAEEKSASLNTVFGSDARRAANVLIGEGSKGVGKYLKQTSDLTAAQKLADASMSGTAGAIESLSGSLDTAKILIGKGLAPVIQDLANNTSDFLSNAPIDKWAEDSGRAVADLLTEVAPLAKSLFEVGQSALPVVADAAKLTGEALGLVLAVVEPIVDAFNSLPASAQQALILAAGAHTLSSRMSGLPGLAGASGGGLLAFGANAKAAGADSKTAAGSVKILSTALKANALLIGAAVILPDLADQTSTFVNSFKSIQGASEALRISMDRNGRSTADTVTALGASFADGNIGKYADDLGVDIDALTKDFAKNGIEGKTVQDTIRGLEGRYSTFKDVLTDFSPFGTTESDKIRSFIDALNDAGDGFDGLHRKAARVGEDMNNMAIDMLFADGKSRGLAERLKSLPNEVKTAVLTPGATDSTAKVVKLAKQYKLTPKQIRTVMEANGKFAEKDIKAVLKLLGKVEKKRKAKVDADTSDAERKLTALQNLLRSLHNKTIVTTLKTIGTGPKKGSGSYTGGRVPAGFVGGGIVPGTPPPRANIDNVLAMGDSGETFAVRSGEWIINEAQSRKNDSWLRAVNGGLDLNKVFGSYATGGVAGSSGSNGSGLSFDQLIAALNKLSLGIVTQTAAQARFDKFSALDSKRATVLDRVQQRQQVRDLGGQLSERVKKGKHKGEYTLKGLDREAAKLELADARKQLAAMNATNKALKTYGTLKQEQARLDKAEAAATAVSGVMDNFGIDGLTSTAAIDRRLTQALSNIGEFTLVLADLKKAGASPWLLDQLIAAGPTKTAIKIGKQYLADSAALASINAKSGALGGVSGAYATVATGGTLSASQKTILIDIRALDISQLSGEIARQVSHQMNTAAIGAGV